MAKGNNLLFILGSLSFIGGVGYLILKNQDKQVVLKNQDANKENSQPAQVSSNPAYLIQRVKDIESELKGLNWGTEKYILLQSTLKIFTKALNKLGYVYSMKENDYIKK